MIEIVKFKVTTVLALLRDILLENLYFKKKVIYQGHW